MKVRMLGQNRPPSVTALKFLGESLFHGEETGKSFVWSLPDRLSRQHSFSINLALT